MKTCNKCGKIKDLSEFSPNKENRDGRKGTCKECRSNGEKRKKEQLFSRGLKQCRKCLQVKELSEFYESGYIRQFSCASYESTCKSCDHEKAISDEYKRTAKRYNEKHPEKVKEHQENQNRKRYATEDGKEKQRGYYKKYLSKDPRKYNARTLVNLHVKFGLIPRPDSVPCKYCGQKAIHYHHPDYDKPLFVEAVCLKCHASIHRSDK